MEKVEPPYVALPDCILGLTGLRPTAKLLWAYLQRLQGPAWARLPCQTQMAEACALSEKTVHNCLKGLERHLPPVFAVKPGDWPGASSRHLYRCLDPRRQKEGLLWKKGAAPMTFQPEDEQKSRGQNGKRVPQQITEEDNNKNTHKPATDCARAESAQEPTKEEKHIVGTVFPHGCTDPQRQRLLQAVVQGRRMGAPYWFIRRAALWHPELAPWKSIERELALLVEDAMESAAKFDLPLFTIPAYRNFLAGNVNNPSVRSWIRSEEQRCKRANAMLSEPEVWNEKSRRPGQRPGTSTQRANRDAGAAPRPTLTGGVE